MERKECEELILEKVKEINDIYKKYNPEGLYLAISVIENRIHINNAYYSEDIDKPLLARELADSESKDHI